MELDVAEAEGVGAAAAADATSDGERLGAAEDFRGVVEENFVDDAGFESGPIDLAAGFNH